MKRKSAKKTKKVGKTGLSLVLNGKIELVEHRNGKVMSREEIDGEVVLKVIVASLERYLNELTGS